MNQSATRNKKINEREVRFSSYCPSVAAYDPWVFLVSELIAKQKLLETSGGFPANHSTMWGILRDDGTTQLDTALIHRSLAPKALTSQLPSKKVTGEILGKAPKLYDMRTFPNFLSIGKGFAMGRLPPKDSCQISEGFRISEPELTSGPERDS
jgi:hypothetical protein